MFTRRTMLKLGLAGSGYLILGPDGAVSRADDFDLPPSPDTEPFIAELPLPALAFEADPPFEYLDEYLKFWVDAETRFFKIASEERWVRFHPHLPLTPIWGYKDLSLDPLANQTVGAGSRLPLPYNVLGPTLVQRFGGLEPPRNLNPVCPGTTPAMPIGGGILVRHINYLPKYHEGFGVPRTSIHLHGGHHLARADGFPENIENRPENPLEYPDGFPRFVVMEPPGFVPRADEPPLRPVNEAPSAQGTAVTDRQVLDYYYPILEPGCLDVIRCASTEPDTEPDDPDFTERPSTQWYHDHLLDFTAPNAYRGLAGVVLCFDEVDSNDEDDLGAKALQLPSGDFDIPLTIQDKRFDDQGRLVYGSFDHDGFLGDKWVVNGAIQPFLTVQRRKYRFRFLNASNARIYSLYLTNQLGATFTMTQIATEGGLLAKPITTDERGRPFKSFMLSMAERVEVVIDFSTFAPGTRLYIENRLFQDEGRKPEGIVSRGDKLLEFRVVEREFDDPSHVGKPGKAGPNTLRYFEAVRNDELARAYQKLRTFRFDRSHGAWTINGRLAGNLERPVAQPKRGVPEIWRLENNSGGWWHPVHIHSEFMRVIRRNGRLPPLNERDGMAKKDTILLRDNESVEVYLKFRDHLGPFVFHCHNMEHEDMAMMARFDVVP